MVYEFEMWVMAHSAGVDVALGTDFMIPAGIRLDLFHGAAQLPNEIRIPLVKTKNMLDSEEYGSHVNAGSSDQLDIPGHEWREYRLSKRQVALERHILWVRRTEKIIPSVTKFRRGRPQRIKLANVSDRAVDFPAHDDIAVLVPVGDLPRGDGYVRVDSKKYRDWQVLAYEGSRDSELFQRECELYERWLATQPPSVERPDYPEPQGVAMRPPQDSLECPGDRLTCAERWDQIMEERERVEASQTSGVTTGDPIQVQFSRSSSDSDTSATREYTLANEGSRAHPHGHVAATKVVDTVSSVRSTPTVNARKMEDEIVTLESTCVSVVRVLTTEGNEASDNTRIDHYEHPANTIGLEDYAKELAFLPDFTEESNTTIDYDSPNVTDPRLSTDRQERLIATLKTHELIMIASGNALPLSAYGVVCDIDTQGHASIKQRARRVPLRYLGKLYELLRALLRAGLIVFSDSPLALPFVIVMKNNGQDIRLCIDYKMMNAITAIMEYAMPLVDDLLTDLECYLWFCSPDDASGF
ncbi:hypothetical protein PC119_g7993 [Phytophthora cactorum]|uniref:Reverse transcriptase domain-containing protein n=1 Tax=Phytophthora cactorum TaxID=29920 RepID=A0A8T1AZR1_9STRA|nr:hypothetical protein PC117_g23752 [Phytophthora cactorum]KAG3025944.1 hypothetical protein PC119_g7993 [Phytophthora cactorum]